MVGEKSNWSRDKTRESFNTGDLLLPAFSFLRQGSTKLLKQAAAARIFHPVDVAPR